MRTTLLILPCYNHSPYQPQFSFQNTNLMSHPSRKSVASEHIMYFHTSTLLFMLFFFSPFGKNRAHLLKSCPRIISLEKSHLSFPVSLENNCCFLPPSRTAFCLLHDHRCLSFLPDKDFPKGILYLNHWQRVDTQNMLKKSMVTFA